MSSQSTSVPSVCVIVPSHNEGDQLRTTVHALLATLPADGEVIVIDDASTDGSANFLDGGGYGGVRLLRPSTRLGAPGARNYGAAVARADVLVFSDAHVQPPPGWSSALMAVLDRAGVGAVAPAIAVAGRPDAKGYGFTWNNAALDVAWLGPGARVPYAVPMLPAGFMAVRRTAFEDIGGFDPGLVLWGCEDQELSLHLWCLGYECLLVPEVVVVHRFRKRFPYQLDWELTLHNKLRMAAVHFGAPRLGRVIAALGRSPRFSEALARLLDGDVNSRRALIRRRRKHDDDWFCDRFAIQALQ